MSALNSYHQPMLTLGSSSPRRRDLLALLGLPFVIRASDVEEVDHAGEGPTAMAVRLSQAKARAVLAHVRDGLIVAADTLVYLDGEVLGKPAGPAEAADMLRRLRGRSHLVFSGLTVIDAQSGGEFTQLAQTTVWMRNYSDTEIATYVASGDPLDKAGSYAIQYQDFRPVLRVAGCFANVMGLPLCHLYCVLREVGLAPVETPVAACDHYNRRTCDVALQILEA
jgi:MAF protein